MGDLNLDGNVAAEDYIAIDATLGRTDGGVETLVFRKKTKGSGRFFVKTFLTPLI